MSSRVPSDLQRYLTHMPTIALWIDQDRRFSSFEIGIFGLFAPDLHKLFKGASFEKVRDMIAPYQNDPQYGAYVRKVLSPEGEKWLRRTLAQL